MFKNVISAVIMLMGLNLYSQIDCNITLRYPPDTTKYHNDTTLCFNSNLVLYTQFDITLNYSWEPNGETGVIIEVNVTDTITYILHVYNDDSTFHCTDTVTINIFPKVIIEFEQLKFGCPLTKPHFNGDTNYIIPDTICKAQVKANAIGGYPPYHYNWGNSVIVNPGDSSLALNLCVLQTYTLLVSDTVCSYTEDYDVRAFNLPQIEFTLEPDSLFETNPKAVLSFENKSADSIPITYNTWIFQPFPDGYSTNELNPSYVFTTNDTIVKFTYTTIDGCNTDTIKIPIKVNPFKLQPKNVFTPNGDGVNDTFVIPDLDRYISNELYVFNRWGELVFSAKNYSDDWDGGRLSDGVYFYILKCQGYWEEDVFRGSVSIYGSKY
jgi:gliding motility-associated-like protein